MSGWVKVDKDLAGSIRFRRCLRAFRESSRSVTRDSCDAQFLETLLLGCLLRLWSYADTHITDDDRLDASVEEIDELVGVPGFAASLPAEWLVVIDANTVQLPDFLAHNGTSARERRLAAKRQAEHRHRKKGAPVTARNALRHASNDARPDQTRPDQTYEARAPEPPKPPEIPDSQHATEFAGIRAAYPDCTGDPRWIEAERNCRRLVDAGHSWAELLQAAQAYRAYVKAGGVSGAAFVRTPANFFGSESWRQAWTPPPPRKAPGGLDPLALAAWDATIRTEGANRATDPRAARALEAIGGYLRVKGRTDFTEREIRAEFCRHYAAEVAA
jgi:hypothetical protein